MAWDETIFARIGESYDLVFAQEVAQTARQIEFVVDALRLRPGQRILDLCCGPGRHALELARRGMAVTAVDRDPTLLALGRRRAEAERLAVRWIEADARRLPRVGPFHAGICLFASWGQAEDPAQNTRLLGSVAQRLLPEGRFLLDIPNVRWLQEHPEGRSLSLAGGTAVRERRTFDPGSRLLAARWHVRQPGRPPWQTEVRYRVYGAEEMEWILASAGLILDAAYGGFDGSALSSASPRCLLLSRRPTLPMPPSGGRLPSGRSAGP